MIDMKTAYLSVLGGVAACSPDLYAEAMREIAARAGRVVDAEFRDDVREVARQLPCPID